MITEFFLISSHRETKPSLKPLNGHGSFWDADHGILQRIFGSKNAAALAEIKIIYGEFFG